MDPISRDPLVRRVAELASLDLPTAKRAVEAVLQTLAVRLSEGEVDDLVESLSADWMPETTPLNNGACSAGSSDSTSCSSFSGSSSSTLERDESRAVFGQVMGLVALTVGCTALGAYIGRHVTGGAGIAFYIGAFGCIIGLNFAVRAGREQLVIGLLSDPGRSDARISVAMRH